MISATAKTYVFDPYIGCRRTGAAWSGGRLAGGRDVIEVDDEGNVYLHPEKDSIGMDWEVFGASFDGKPSSVYGENLGEIWGRMRSFTSGDSELDPSSPRGAGVRYHGNVMVHGVSVAPLFDPHSQVVRRIFVSGDGGNQGVLVRLDELDFRPSGFHQRVFDSATKYIYYGAIQGNEYNHPVFNIPGRDWAGRERSQLLRHLTGVIGRHSIPGVADVPRSFGIWGTPSTSDWFGGPFTHAQVREYELPTSAEPIDPSVKILRAMRRAGLGVACDRLAYLYEVLAEDPDEPQISFESLELLARFLISNRTLSTDRLGVDSTGFLSATWILRREVPQGFTSESDGSLYWGDGDGILAMVFQPDGLVSFAANSGPPVEGLQRLRCSGTFPLEQVLSKLSDFTPWLLS